MLPVDSLLLFRQNHRTPRFWCSKISPNPSWEVLNGFEVAISPPSLRLTNSIYKLNLSKDYCIWFTCKIKSLRACDWQPWEWLWTEVSLGVKMVNRDWKPPRETWTKWSPGKDEAARTNNGQDWQADSNGGIKWTPDMVLLNFADNR